MVERDAKVLKALRENSATLGSETLELVAADALKFLARESRRFDIIFVDPPYDSGLLPALLPSLLPCLADDGMVYAESDAAFDPGSEWLTWRSGSAGQVHYYLLKKAI